MYPGSLYFDDCDKGAESTDILRLVFRLLVDLRDGALDDFEDDRLSGMTTTGIPPFFQTSLRALPIDEVVEAVPLEEVVLR